MNWRTDKPTADVILAKFNNIYEILNRDEQGNYFLQNGFVKKFVLTNDIEKWADLEEGETVTDCNELKDEMSRFITRYFSTPDYAKDYIAEVDWENSMRECARHFAKWGAEHLKK